MAISLMALNSNATTLSNVGPLTITWKVAQQGVMSPPTLSTNHTTKETNVVSKYKSTITTSIFTDADLLALLTNSFKTNLAKTDKLVTDGENVYVVDSKGSNVVLDISSVVSVTFETSVYSGAETETVSYQKTNTTTSAIGTDSGISYVKLNYDDSTMITNGTATTFHFDGVSMSAIDFSTTNGYITEQLSENFSVQGVGNGTIQGTGSVIWGTITGSSKGTEGY